MGSPKSKASEQRAFDRYAVKIQAQIRPIGAKNWIEAEINNLSKGGSCVYSHLSFFVGQMIEVLIFNSEGKETLRKAIVVWRKQNQHGINFIN